MEIKLYFLGNESSRKKMARIRTLVVLLALGKMISETDESPLQSNIVKRI